MLSGLAGADGRCPGEMAGLQGLTLSVHVPKGFLEGFTEGYQ